MSRINCMCKRQKKVKGLKFGDRQNLINDAISTGVHEGPDPNQLHNVPHHDAPSNAIQNDILIDESTAEDQENDKDNDEDVDAAPTEQNYDGIIDEVGEADTSDEDDDGSNGAEVAVENRADEVMAGSINEDSSDDSDAEDGTVRTRPGRSIRPYDFKIHFPETAHVQMSIQDGKWLKPYYCDDEKMMEKLGKGIFYQELYFVEFFLVTELEAPVLYMPIESWSDRDQY